MEKYYRMSNRAGQIDFVKGVMIVAMVLFHLQAFTDVHTTLTSWVYTFHMPIFLILSGYLFNYKKELPSFLKSLRSLVVPLFVFEAVYMASLLLLGNILGSRTLESIEIDNLGDFIIQILFLPRGTFWYLHTISLCMIVVYVVNRLTKFKNGINTLIISSLLLFGLTLTGMNFNWSNVLYFILGLIIKNYNINLVDKKFASVLAIIPVVLITIFSQLYTKNSISGIGLSIFILSFLVAIHTYIHTYIQNLFEYLGKNSLSIVLFSPFTLTALRYFIKPFSFDSSNILYAVLIVSLAIVGCLAAAIISDKLKISRIIVGKDLYAKL